MAAGEGEGCLWWRLFMRGNQALKLWTCLCNWRFVALRKKRRFTQLKAHEQLDVEFVEDDLPLHELMCCIGTSDAQVQAMHFEWVHQILGELPTACESIDRHQRVPLFYALTQRWIDIDRLSWLVAKSQHMLLRKDANGRSLMAQAVLHNCPQEIIMLMAVELACRSMKSVETFIEGRHFESARRLCHCMVKEYFAGVPQFPHAFCLDLLRTSDVLTALDGLQMVWREFVDKWGYYGVPVIVDDLPSIRHAALDSFLQLSIKAKGEPLIYQWFCNDGLIVGATQSSLYVAQRIQPHNEGVYFCQVTNWKGRAVSTAMQLAVVDDTHGPDPSLRFLLSDSDCASLSCDNVVHRIAASRGGLVHASLGGSSESDPMIMSGCSLLLPPKCFSSFDANGHDVSEAVGMDVVVRQATMTTVQLQSQLRLSRNEKLVSIVVEVLPFTLPVLTQPAILSIPHCWCGYADTLHELVVVEFPVQDTTSSTALLSTDRSNATRSQGYQEIDRARLLELTEGSGGVVSFEISRFGRFAVIARSVASQNKDNEPPLEDVVLCIAHPDHLSSGHGSTTNRPATLRCSVWLALNRPDSLTALQRQINETDQQLTNEERNDDTRTAMSTMRLSLREGQMLYLQLGLKKTISHVWRGKDESNRFGVSKTPPTTDGVVCLREDLLLPMGELAMDPHADTTGAGSITIFRVLDLKLVVLKPSRYQPSKLRPTSQTSSDRKLPLPDGLLVFEKDWTIPLPVIHDRPQQPTQPSLYQRRPNQLALVYDSNPVTTTLTQFESLHEMEREFSPYYYQVEMARFAQTFWQRYDRTWWFDKTKSEILLGMYRMAHSGTEPFTALATDAFAGAIRVVQCSLDASSAYSEPLLLKPLEAANAVWTGGTDSGDADAESHLLSGLRDALGLPDSLDLSPQSRASLNRLRIVLGSVYSAFPPESFLALIGVPRDLEAVRVHLENQRDSVRAANREVALLVLAMDRLALWIHKRVVLRARFFGCVWRKLALLRRLIPEIDCFPLEYNAVIVALHTLVRDLYEIALACSSPGWFARLLRDEWYEADLQAIISRTLRLLHSEARTLLGANEIIEVLETFIVGEDNGTGLDLERYALQSLREYLLLVIRQISVDATALVRREIAALLWQFTSPAIRERTTLEDWADLVTTELQSEATTQAVQHLCDHETLAKHLRSVTPRDHEQFSGLAIPPRICFNFDLHVMSVDTLHALKVTNATLRCIVQGQTKFSRAHKRLKFVPALPFDKHMRYQVKLRAQYIQTALGRALPPASTITIEFFTSS